MRHEIQFDRAVQLARAMAKWGISDVEMFGDPLEWVVVSGYEEEEEEEEVWAEFMGSKWQVPGMVPICSSNQASRGRCEK